MLYIRDSYRTPGTPAVTWSLLIINLLSFLASKNGVGYSLGEIISVGGMLPAEYDRSDLILGNYRQLGAFVPLLWHQFLHGGWFHLISNAVVLAIFGPNLEMYMGRARFLMFYLTCGCVGGLFQVLSNLNSTQFVIGASGAVSGLFGAYFNVFPNNYIRITMGNLRSRAYRDVMVPVKVILVFWAASQIMDAMLPTVGERQSIAYFSHLGGFLAGFLLAKGKGGTIPTSRNFRVFMGGKSRDNS